MKRFNERETKISGLFRVSRDIIKDDRGNLSRLFCTSELKCWQKRPIVQVNKTHTLKKGTIRGLHYQTPPYAEAKLIFCLRGVVHDFAVDVRKYSKTFGKVFQITLDADLHDAVLLPEGVAHGFQSLTDDVEMLYFHSQPYVREVEAGVNVFDASLELNLDLNLYSISEKDLHLPYLRDTPGVVI